VSKAGLFAGEETQAAPTNGALTTKQRGYHWFEWAKVIPMSGEFSETSGHAATTNNKVASPRKSHPFVAEVYNEFTMSATFQSAVDPELETKYTAFSMDNSIHIQITDRSFTNYLEVELRSSYQGDTSQLFAGQLQINSQIDWLPTDWYCITLTYSYPLDVGYITYTNLTRGEEVTETKNPTDARPMAWEDSGEDEVYSSMGYGCTYGDISAVAVSPFVGSIANVLVHDQFVDLTIEENRRRFCGIDGVINLGGNGQAAFGSTPKIYLPRGYPDDQRGTVYIGEYLADFYVAEPLDPDVNLPPISSG